MMFSHRRLAYPHASAYVFLPPDARAARPASLPQRSPPVSTSAPRIWSAAGVARSRMAAGAYRDGIKFGNGKEISLQLLGSGVAATLVATAEKPQSNRERRVVLETVE